MLNSTVRVIMAHYSIVPAIKRAFEVIEFLATKAEGANLSEVHQALHLPLSSAANILFTLTDLGYLERDAAKSTYHMSVKMFGMARHAADRLDPVAQCHGLLEDLVRRSKLTGQLAVLRGTNSMYVDRVQSDSFVQFKTYVGMCWPAHTAAVGKVLLAFQQVEELRRLLEELDLKKITPYTVGSRRVLASQLGVFRRLGYAWEQSEGELGVGCVAAPVFGPNHKLVAGVSLTGTTLQVSKSTIPKLGALVKKYARRMSARLGDEV